MFSTLLRSRQNSRRVSIRDASRPTASAQRQWKRSISALNFAEPGEDEATDGDLERFPSQVDTRAAGDDEEEEEADEDGDGQIQYGSEEAPDRRGGLPVLPLFSSSHLDALPVYNTTHAVRIIVCTRTETTLTWEQLRSPQISQFLVKPMQQQLRAQHFSRATLYALMANCLQFNKEAQQFAANAGINNTRAKVCELLALKILKEYTTRELIDALAYDFYPLQGLPGASSPLQPGKAGTRAYKQLTASRTSTLEVAIRASAKHFLAHPVVVQQLEAIWKGAITFYSSADTLHRTPPASPGGQNGKGDVRTPLLGSLPQIENHRHVPAGRRTVMLYDPRQASLFKLSRLRVPRYRSFLSTLSLAVLIALFLAVLSRRSAKITGLELVFWFWSAGFMLDELVGFSEQGFALYIMSFWNIFDLGILVLLIVYYCMRVYGVFLADPHHWNSMAYDVLAANAILLLPRIFSILDHYQYFSQLLIAFRLMAVDLTAVLILVLVTCSGFFVFFTLSNDANDAPDIAYKIFQILMGFSPAAWDLWPSSNFLARTLLVLFMVICHFLVVTILITVLTNSFMAIALNATEEHQFLFAINTIAMVKDNAMFSYIAPSNIFAWLMAPLRFCMPLKQFVWLNRTVIKITHLPILFCIYLYERLWLAPSIYEPTDLVERPQHRRGRRLSLAVPDNRSAIFSPNLRVREESVAGFQKDRALEEVFRRAPVEATLRTQRRQERRKQQHAIRSWMDQHDEAPADAPVNWSTLNSRSPMPDWQRRLSVGWVPSSLRKVSDLRSIASDPADLMSNLGTQTMARASAQQVPSVAPNDKDQTDADGDDELVTNEEDEDDDDRLSINLRAAAPRPVDTKPQEDYFSIPTAAKFVKLPSSHGSTSANVVPRTPRPADRKGHRHTSSTETVLLDAARSSQPQRGMMLASPMREASFKKVAAGRRTGTNSPSARATRQSSPRRAAYLSTASPRPVLPPRGATDIGAGGGAAGLLNPHARQQRLREKRRLSSMDMSMTSDQMASEDAHPGVAGSFQTQMAMAMMKNNRLRAVDDGDEGDRDRMGRLMLARMKTLEESFAEVVKEMRDLKKQSTGSASRWNSSTEEVGGGFEGGGASRANARTGNTVRTTRRRGDRTPKKDSLVGRPWSRRSGGGGSGKASPSLRQGQGPASLADDEGGFESGHVGSTRQSL